MHGRMRNAYKLNVKEVGGKVLTEIIWPRIETVGGPFQI
jgi:hypothetical protein